MNDPGRLNRSGTPKLLGWVFRRIVPHPRGEEVWEDLVDEYRQRRQEGVLAAEWWLWKQVLRPDTLRLNAAFAELNQRSQTGWRSVGIMDRFFRDLQYGLRGLKRSPTFSGVAIATLAVGIAATTTVFSVVNGVLLQSLPYPDSDQIMWVAEHHSGRGRDMPVAFANFRDWEASATSFSHLAMYNSGQTLVLGGEQAVSDVVARVGGAFWGAIGALPIRGRLPAPEELTAEGPDLVVLREDVWRTQFGASDLSAIRIELYGRPHQVVGVIADESAFPQDARLWTRAVPSSESRSSHNWRVVGRLATGVTAPQAEAELDPLQARLTAPEGPSDYLGDGVTIVPLRTRISGSATTPLYLLLGAAGFVLLVACTNLASALLARGSVRDREMAVRSSVGADRGRLLTQLLTESLALAVIGGLAGLALTYVSLEGVLSLAAGTLPRIAEVGIDLPVFFFAMASTLGTTLLFGFVPALKLSRQDVANTMRAGRGVRPGGRSRGWDLLLGAEIVMAVILAVGAALLMRSFGVVTAVDPGFTPEAVAVQTNQLNPTTYPEAADHIRFYEEFLSGLESRPEIAVAGVGSALPLSGAPNGLLALDGDQSQTTTALYVLASPGYFDALGIELIQGRPFSDQDRPDTRHVAIVNRSFAEAVWPGEDPIGRQVNGGGMDEFWEDGRFAEVVGVVEDARFEGVTVPASPTVFMSHAQRPGRLRFSSYIVARAADGSATAALTPLRELLRQTDDNIPLRVEPFSNRVSDTLGERKFMMILLGAFAVIALSLAALGVYGVVSYNLEQQRREIGIRLALGAEPRQVRNMVQQRIIVLAGAGAIVGLLGASYLSRYLQSLLFEIDALDPISMLAAGGLLAVAAWVAAIIPAIRSSRMDPTSAIRSD